MKFRKKPVVIDAIQWMGHISDIEYFIDSIDYYVRGKSLFIPTLEGDMETSIGDWIIRGVVGEFYPCKNNVFVATYDKVIDE